MKKGKASPGFVNPYKPQKKKPINRTGEKKRFYEACLIVLPAFIDNVYLMKNNKQRNCKRVVLKPIYSNAATVAGIPFERVKFKFLGLGVKVYPEEIVEAACKYLGVDPLTAIARYVDR